MLIALFSCTQQQSPKKPTVKKGYLKETISQSELNNTSLYKRYYYTCKNTITGKRLSLTTYFPLSRESRMKENFGIYFQLVGDKAIPFDHIENRALNARGTRFEVIYRSYYPVDGSYIDLIARQHSTTYYKTVQGMKKRWLECKEG